MVAPYDGSGHELERREERGGGWGDGGLDKKKKGEIFVVTPHMSAQFYCRQSPLKRLVLYYVASRWGERQCNTTKYFFYGCEPSRVNLPGFLPRGAFFEVEKMMP